MTAKTTNYYFCPKCIEPWDVPGCDSMHDDECPSCGKPYTPFENEKARDARMSSIKIKLIDTDFQKNKDLSKMENNLLRFVLLQECLKIPSAMDHSSDRDLLEVYKMMGLNYLEVVRDLARKGYIDLDAWKSNSNISQKATESQIKRLSNDWSLMAGEKVKVEKHGGTYFGFCSELGALRVYKKYNGKGRAEYSSNLKTWFFALDT